MDSFVDMTQFYRYKFADFYAAKGQHEGPGWYVYGRNSEKYGIDEAGKGRYVALCARPDVPARRLRNWNSPVRRGWRTRREAQAVADAMNDARKS